PEPKTKRRLQFSFRFPPLLAITGSGEEVDDVVIVFMTGIFVHLLFRIDPRPGYKGRPRLGPRLWVFLPEFVICGFSIDAAEAFGDTKCLGTGILINGAIVRSKIGCFDDERITFPVPTRVAQPLLEVLVEMWPPIKRNHASTMDHFGRDHHVTRTLEDLKIVVVDRRQVRRWIFA